MATSKARKEAKSSLGSFDTSGYENLRNSVKSAYDTAVADAGNQWSNLQERLTSSRKASAGEFAKGRGNVTEANYLANRADLNRRAAGGTTASGFSDINNLGNRMELGRQYSDLANTYYSALEGIDRDQREGEQTYNMALRRAADEYNTGLANIGLAQQSAQNEYNRALASLAEGIQSRWDANANATASLKAQREANNAALALQKSGLINGALQGLSANSSDQDILNAYERLKYFGLGEDEIQQALRTTTGLNNLDFMINSSGNVALLRRNPVVKDYYNVEQGGTTPFSFNTTPVNYSSLPSQSPYQDLLNKSNKYLR